MAVGDLSQLWCGRIGHALAQQQLDRLVAIQRADRNECDRIAQLRGRHPARHRGLATGEHHAHGVRQVGDELLAKPGVDQAQDLVLVDDDDDSRPKLGQSSAKPVCVVVP